MSNFTTRYVTIFKALLPAPFTIAVLLTFLTMILAFFVTRPVDSSWLDYSGKILTFWETGLWNNNLLVFALQMMLMLVLGHVLALTKPVNGLIKAATGFCTNTANAAALVSFLTLCVSLFNWGLGLIFGAIFARKVGEAAINQGYKINYPIIGAAGYAGLMVWHGGLSGSAPVKINEPGHLTGMMKDIFSEAQLKALPDQITYAETIFSSMNISISLIALAIIPLVFYSIGKKSKATMIALKSETIITETEEVTGAERLDVSKVLGIFFSLIILCICVYKMVQLGYKYFSPNNINLLLFGAGLLLHGNFRNYLKGIDQAIAGAAGILIQFPLYFGIMGIMKSSGLVEYFSNFFVSVSNETTFPIFTFISAGIVNVFVPSGGGQWAVQGPIILQAATELNVSIPKSVMALAYGDQLTNMLQPFWALPLLGITQLKAKDILPYTLFLMVIGAGIFVIGLLVF